MKYLLLVVVECVFEVLFFFGELLGVLYFNQVAEVALDPFDYLRELIFMVFRQFNHFLKPGYFSNYLALEKVGEAILQLCQLVDGFLQLADSVLKGSCHFLSILLHFQKHSLVHLRHFYAILYLDTQDTDGLLASLLLGGELPLYFSAANGDVESAVFAVAYVGVLREEVEGGELGVVLAEGVFYGGIGVRFHESLQLTAIQLLGALMEADLRIIQSILQHMFKQEESIKKPEENKEDDSGEEDEDVEKEVVGNWKLVDLPEMPKVTGEEEEEELSKFRSKIYRFRAKEWKERGIGELRFLKHKTSGYVRVLVRAEKTHKCIMNHFVISKDIFCQLEQLKTSNNSWTWAAYDISDEEPQSEKFCAKFTSKDDFEKFQAEFKRADELNKVVNSSKAEKVEEKVEDKGEGKVEDKGEGKVEDKGEEKGQ